MGGKTSHQEELQANEDKQRNPPSKIQKEPNFVQFPLKLSPQNQVAENPNKPTLSFLSKTQKTINLSQFPWKKKIAENKLQSTKKKKKTHHFSPSLFLYLLWQQQEQTKEGDWEGSEVVVTACKEM